MAIIYATGEPIVLGTDEDDEIHGSSSSEEIRGGDGNDTIFSGDDLNHGGEDTLIGGSGDDLFILKNQFLDVVTIDGGDGFDTLRIDHFPQFMNSDVSGIERVELAGTDTGQQVWMKADQVFGDDGENRFEIASDGVSCLLIQADDHHLDASGLVLENWGDEDVLELVNFGEGPDTIIGSRYDDAIVDFGGDDLLSGGRGDDRVDGRTGADELYGDRGADILHGDEGRDLLVGGRGSDTLYGGDGKDRFVLDRFEGHPDLIADFSRKDDTILLQSDRFHGLEAGRLTEDAFCLGAKAEDADDRIIYDHKTGALYFDRDGSGDKYEAIKIATLEHAPKLGAEDFLIF